MSINSFSNGSANAGRPCKKYSGRVVRKTVQLTLEEMYKGTTCNIHCTGYKCLHCDPSNLQSENPNNNYITCKRCRQLTSRKTTIMKVVTITGGTRPGQIIKYAPKTGTGDAAVITVAAMEHEKFQLRGDDLVASIPFEEVEPNSVFYFETLDNRRIPLRSPQYIYANCEMCVKGEGMPTYKNEDRKGNLILRFVQRAEAAFKNCFSPRQSVPMEAIICEMTDINIDDCFYEVMQEEYTSGVTYQEFYNGFDRYSHQQDDFSHGSTY